MSDELVAEASDPGPAVLAASRSPLAAMLERVITRVGPCPGISMVAVSGGPDSTALLLLAHALMARRTPPVFERLIVGHVDHAIRPESDSEAMQVRALAARLGVEFMMERLVWHDESSISSARAREARWSALQRIAEARGVGTILCGHHADDQAETVVLRLARGTGLKGIAGIPEVRELDEGIRIIRPLLQARRQDLLDLIEASGVPVVHDPTNRRSDVARGVVRHEVLPRLEGIHPGATARIAATAEEAGSAAHASADAGPWPGPESIRWRRQAFKGHDETTVAGKIRESIRSLSGISVGTVQAVPRSTWAAIARAVLDDQDRPRTFSLPGIGRIRVEVRSVQWDLDEESADESSTLSS